MSAYNEKLAPDHQITTEEEIAVLLFDEYGLHEEKAADAGREILKLVLYKFRPDLFVQESE